MVTLILLVLALGRSAVRVLAVLCMSTLCWLQIAAALGVFCLSLLRKHSIIVPTHVHCSRDELNCDAMLDKSLIHSMAVAHTVVCHMCQLIHGHISV